MGKQLGNGVVWGIGIGWFFLQGNGITFIIPAFLGAILGEGNPTSAQLFFLFYSIEVIIQWALIGLLIAALLRWSNPAIKTRHLVAIILIWVVCAPLQIETYNLEALLYSIFQFYGYIEFSFPIGYFIAGFCTAFILRLAHPPIKTRQMLIIGIGWSVVPVLVAVFQGLIPLFPILMFVGIPFFFVPSLSGFVGALVMMWQLDKAFWGMRVINPRQWKWAPKKTPYQQLLSDLMDVYQMAVTDNVVNRQLLNRMEWPRTRQEHLILGVIVALSSGVIAGIFGWVSLNSLPSFRIIPVTLTILISLALLALPVWVSVLTMTSTRGYLAEDGTNLLRLTGLDDKQFFYIFLLKPLIQLRIPLVVGLALIPALAISAGFAFVGTIYAYAGIGYIVEPILTFLGLGVSLVVWNTFSSLITVVLTIRYIDRQSLIEFLPPLSVFGLCLVLGTLVLNSSYSGLGWVGGLFTGLALMIGVPGILAYQTLIHANRDATLNRLLKTR